MGFQGLEEWPSDGGIDHEIESRFWAYWHWFVNSECRFLGFTRGQLEVHGLCLVRAQSQFNPARENFPNATWGISLLSSSRKRVACPRNLAKNRREPCQYVGAKPKAMTVRHLMHHLLISRKWKIIHGLDLISAKRPKRVLLLHPFSRLYCKQDTLEAKQEIFQQGFSCNQQKV